MIRVVICDDQAVVRRGLALILAVDPGVQVVGQAGDGRAALAVVAAQRPDLVLMDLMMPGMNGIQATAAIRARFPLTAVLVLTTYDADEWVFDALRQGAAGYLLKDTAPDVLLAAVKGTIAGQTYLDPGVAGKVVRQATAGERPRVRPLPGGVTEREVAIWSLLARGRSNAEIAAILHLSEGRVRNQVSSLLRKLGVGDRTQAALLAVQFGLGTGA